MTKYMAMAVILFALTAERAAADEESPPVMTQTASHLFDDLNGNGTSDSAEGQTVNSGSGEIEDFDLPPTPDDEGGSMGGES